MLADNRAGLLKGAALASLLVLAACGAAPEDTARRAPPRLDTLLVEAGTTGVMRDWDGVVSAERQAMLSAQTAGRVTDIAVDVGDQVSAGQRLLGITAVEQNAGVRAAQAQLKAAEASLVEAGLAFTRASELVERGLVARSQLDQAIAARDSAKAAREAARAQLAQARQKTGYTSVVAPFDGVISARQAMPGEAVAPGSALLTVVDPQSQRLDVVLPQSVAAGIADDANAQLLLADGSLRRPARLIVFPVADPKSHSVTLRAQLPGDLVGVTPGQTLRLRLPESASADGSAIRIPESTLLRRGELTAVYVVAADAVSLRQLRLGRSDGESVEVLSGLRAGETIASNPVAALAALKSMRQWSGKAHD